LAFLKGVWPPFGTENYRLALSGEKHLATVFFVIKKIQNMVGHFKAL